MTTRTTRAYCVLTVLFLSSTAAAAGEVAPGWLARAQEHIAEREYRASRNKKGLQAPNRAHDLRTYFGPTGIRVHDRTNPGNTRLFELGLAGLRRGDALTAVEPGKVVGGGNRVEIRRDGLVEWYENSADGLEQGFTLERRPVGEGPLALDLTLAHAEASLRGDAAVIASEAGRRVRYHKLVVSDAAGRTLPAHIELPSAQTIRLVVDDGGARYPVVIDPFFQAGPDTQLDGIDVVEGDEFGFRVAGAGDVDGDGYDDILVSADLYDAGESNEGAAFVFRGGPDGIADGGPLDAAAQIESDQADARLSSVAGAGDVDGDGYDDVLVGAPFYNNTQNNEGAAFLFRGGPTLTGNLDPSDAAARRYSGVADARLGWSVAGAGDVNDDGFADVVVGAPEYSAGQNGEGAVFVFLGGDPAGIELTPSVLQSDSENAEFGWSVAGAGDLDGDGYDDVAVGASRYSHPQNEEGGAFVFRGSSAGIDSGNLATAWWHIESNQGGTPGALLGRSVAGAGDVNGDGYADLLVGASRYDRGQMDEGALFVFHGRAGEIPDGVATDADSIIESDQASAFLGFSSAGAGDVNGDGYADVLVGADQYESSTAQDGEGLALLFLGSADGVSDGNPNSADASIDLNEPGARLGAAVAGAGDVDGDGFDDLLVGALDFQGKGAAFVYLGGALEFSMSFCCTAAPGSPSRLEGDQTDASFGRSVAGAGDVNGDGYGDVIIGADKYDRGEADEGAAFVFHGGPGGITDTSAEEAASVLESNQPGSQFGGTVAGAGDVNGDGYADVIVGRWGWNPASSFVFHGGVSGIPNAAAADADATLQGIAGATLFGFASGAADVNGDGYGDVIVSAPFEDALTGAAYVFLGSSTGVADGGPATAATQLKSDQAGSGFGVSVSGAGDVNGDGYQDVIVGASLYDSPESDGGAAFVFLGGPGGIAHGGPATASARLVSHQVSSLFGDPVSGVGDMNGDGYADVMVAAPFYDGGQGAAFVFHGGPGGVPDGTPATADTPIVLGIPFITGLLSAAGVGDMNGDGYTDVALGFELGDFPPQLYTTAVVRGGGSGVEFINSTAPEKVAGAGDVNGDGYADLITGDSTADNPETDEGAAFVYLGNGEGRPVLARQLRADESGIPIQPGGRMVPPDVLRLELVASHLAGAGRVAGEFEVCPLGVSFGDASCSTTFTPSWKPVDATSPEAVLSQDVTALALGTTHRWRARVLHAPATGPLASPADAEHPDHGPWRRLAAQSNEGDARSVGDCNDGFENDGDGRVDHPADPGCANAGDTSELSSFECDNGQDDDGDGKIDWRGDGSGDPQCVSLTHKREAPGGGGGGGCGLGPELLLLAPILAAVRRRSASGAASENRGTVRSRVTEVKPAGTLRSRLGGDP